MNNVIECICRLLPNKVYVTIPKLQEVDKFYVIGITRLNSDLPLVIVKKDEPNARATFNVPYNLIDKIIVTDFEYDINKENNK